VMMYILDLNASAMPSDPICRAVRLAASDGEDKCERRLLNRHDAAWA
jgi:hypothetical protein